MYDKEALCQKIKTIYPDISECGIDVGVDFDGTADTLVVYLKMGDKKVKHFLPAADAEACMAGKQCVALGIEIAQFRDQP